MGIVDDVVARQQVLTNGRLSIETTWSNIADLCLPDHAKFFSTTRLDGSTEEPSSVSRGRQRYDDTAVLAIDRLAAGMESLVTPQAEKWHGLAITDPLAPEESDEEKEYFERFRDYMFAVRYDSRAGFIGAHQKSLRSCIALGTGVMLVEENMGVKAREVPVRYRYIPLNEAHLSVDAYGEPDTCYRRYNMTARQMAQQFGEERLAPVVKRMLEQTGGMDTTFQIIHAVQPRGEHGSSGSTNRDSAWSSVYVDVSNNHLLGESGFYEFPFIVYYWQPVDNGPYAQSPVMSALSSIKGLNAIRKTSLRGLQQYFDPPMAIAHDGIMNRPNLNPRGMNFGAIDGQGRVKIQPIITNARPDFAQEIIDAERKGVNENLFITLFQILSQNPDMTATEAMIRANEKGELLGPAGGKIQHAMSREVERVAGILQRKGAMDQGAALQPPDSLMGKDFGARFTSPLDRLRRAQEGVGIMRTIEAVVPLAQAEPDILDNYDTDEIARIMPDINGAPHKMLRSIEERDARRQQRQQAQQMQQAAELAKTGGEAARDIIPAISQAQQIAQGQPVPA